MKDDQNNNSETNLIENKLKESEERFALAMRGANDGLWDWNLLTNEVYYSPRWKSMLGYEEHELEGNLATWEKLVHKDDKQKVLDKVQEGIENNHGYEVEMRMIHKNGSHVIVLSRAFLVQRESDLKAIRLVGTHVDITEWKKSEEFTKKTNKILEMIAVGEPASKVYEEIALMYESRHKGIRCSLLELEDGKLLHGGAPSMPEEYCQAVHGLENGPEVGSCGASTYLGKRVLVENIDTDPKWANIKQYALPHGMRSCWSEPIIDSQGNVLGAFGMYYDHPALPNEKESEDLLSAARLASIVMERDQSQKKLLHSKNIISEQSKLASMGEMIGNIAHQWRQPLSAISTSATSAKVLKEIGTFNDEDFDKTMDNIIEKTQYLSQTIEDFRGYFNPKNSELKEISILKTVEKTLKLLKSQLKAQNIEVVCNVEDIKFNSLENELIQVLVNFINNSRDAFLEFEQEEKLIFIDVFKNDSSIIIEFKDNANGIKEEFINRVFEPYFTTKYQYNGTGIGLYMSRDIVRTLLKGDLTVENSNYSYQGKKYKGASFKIDLAL